MRRFSIRLYGEWVHEIKHGLFRAIYVFSLIGLDSKVALRWLMATYLSLQTVV